MKKIFILLLMVLIIIQLNADENNAEIIINQFYEKIIENDFESLVNLFDWHIMKYNFQEYLKVVPLISSISNGTQYPGLNYFNKINMLTKSIHEIETFIFSLLLPVEYSHLLEGRAYPYPRSNFEILNENEIKTFLGYLDYNRLKNLSIIEIEIVEPRIQFSEIQKDIIESRKKIYNCSEIIEYSILYIFEGIYYIGGMTLYRYGEKWYIHTLGSSLLNINLGKLNKIGE